MNKIRPKPIDISPTYRVPDPHHEGTTEWGYHGGKLYQRTPGGGQWSEVYRVSFTPARFRAIASILPEFE